MKEREIVAHPYDMRLIPAKMLTVNKCYQRPEQHMEIKKIINEFDYHLVNPVKVVKRDSFYNVWDGQQTAVALYRKFGENYLVPCMIYYDVTTPMDEAVLLVKTNTGTGRGKKLTQGQVWNADRFAGDPETLAIDKIAGEFGFKIGSGHNRGRTINAVNAIKNSFSILTNDQFRAVLRIISKAWEDDANGINAGIIKGMTRFVKAYDGMFDEANLIRRLSKKSPVVILRNASLNYAKGDAKWAREILAIYNNGTTTNRLPDQFA